MKEEQKQLKDELMKKPKEELVELICGMIEIARLEKLV